MKRIKIKLKGITPLLQHRMTEAELFGLLGKKSERKKDKVEETPRQIAEKHSYRDNDGCLVIPTSYLVGAFRHVASDYKQKSSKRSLKAISGGIFTPEQEFVILKDENNNEIKDFEVDVRKATNHQKGAVAVCRPRIDRWTLETEVSIDDSLVSQETVLEMLNDAGKRSGIGSFRVSKGGSFGRFQVTEFSEIT